MLIGSVARVSHIRSLLKSYKDFAPVNSCVSNKPSFQHGKGVDLRPSVNRRGLFSAVKSVTGFTGTNDYITK